MPSRITISFDRYQDNPAPLFVHKEAHKNSQPAYITLDIETGEVDAQVAMNDEIPPDVSMGFVHRYPIRSDLTSDQVVEALRRVENTLQTIYSNTSLWRLGDEYKIEVNEVARAAEREMPPLIGHDLPDIVIDDLKSWYAESDEVTWLPRPDDDVDDFIKEAESDIKSLGFYTRENVRDCLTQLWANRLNAGGDLPMNVGQALLHDERCNDSQWFSELQDYAEGRDPDDELDSPAMG